MSSSVNDPAPGAPQNPGNPPPKPDTAPKKVQPPIQIYPDPNQPRPHSATATDIRLLREEIMDELDREEPATMILPPVSRVAIWVLACASLVLCVLLWQYVLFTKPWQKNQQSQQTQQPIVPPTQPEISTQPETPPQVPVVAEPPVTPKNVQQPAAAEAETPPLDPGAAQLAELELFAAVFSNDIKHDRSAMLARLQPYIDSVNQKVRERAKEIRAPMMASIDAQARDMARRAAENASEQLEQKDYLKALATVDAALQYLPQESDWANATGAKQLKELRERVLQERETFQVAALKEYVERLKANAEAAKSDSILQHPDPQLRQAAEGLRLEFLDEETRKKVQLHKVITESRNVWLEFFEKYSDAIAAADFDKAAKLAAGVGENPQGGPAVSDQVRVAQGFALEVEAIKRLYDGVIDRAKTLKRSVDFSPRGRRVQGNLEGVEGRNLRVGVRSGAIVTVKVDGLKSGDVLLFLPIEDMKALKMLPAWLALRLCESPAFGKLLPDEYKAANLEMPLHIQERIRLERYKVIDQEIGGRIYQLSQNLHSYTPDQLKAALKELEPLIADFEQFEALSDSRRRVFDQAKKLITKSVRSTIVLQNGAFPNPEYQGILTDQISEYRDSQKKSDVGVRRGLRLGADGGVHRVLLRFDGLDTFIGRGKVKKATLELQQIDSPQHNGAIIGLYRLKRAWVPDQGTWQCFDQAKEQKWAFPGASGGEDIHNQPDTQVFIDKLKNVWRRWDITRYVQDVLGGQQQNHGLLLRVMNGEPDFHVRFYPETDLEAAKRDQTLRPKITIELEDHAE